MAKKKKKKGTKNRKKGGPAAGGGQPVKGFRPGKEPPQVRKQHAKAQLGSDASWAQKQMVEAVGGRSPAEVDAMIRKWSLVLGILAVVLLVGGVFLYGWAVPAGIAVHVLAAVLLFLFFRMRRQRARLREMAGSMSGGRRRP